MMTFDLVTKIYNPLTSNAGRNWVNSISLSISAPTSLVWLKGSEITYKLAEDLPIYIIDFLMFTNYYKHYSFTIYFYFSLGWLKISFHPIRDYGLFSNILTIRSVS